MIRGPAGTATAGHGDVVGLAARVQSVLVDGFPHVEGRMRHGQVGFAQVSESIRDRTAEAGNTAHVRRLRHTLGTDGVVW